ncbi:RNA cap guanine-N2 methyltransferase-domain-containing protein [Sphaerosporella brunnea]|uniref:Trimethylguanosine synthase n=1 Tax=Sphaerosporella brunnea TaxID=1250544 RepID=A0A5J5F0Q9_9PEZI|nr:RNA cap guanine-N2 methyltransferase-domain-containing protein [Sphaerosporella brunnea]
MESASATESSSDASSSDSDEDSSSSTDSDSAESSGSDSSSSRESSSSLEEGEEHDEENSPPPGVTIYTEQNPPQGTLHWYWTQRHRLFSRYEDGIWMTDDSWFEVTPEKVAEKITSHMFPPSSTETETVVMDAFCGVGGNSIQFALSPRVKKVIAVDTSAAAIACARHNAAIYGVLPKIDFVCADFFALVDTRWKFEEIGAVFLSPPWGGPGYRGDHVFNVETMQPYSASYIVRRARTVTENLALYLPRTSDMNQLASLIGDDEEMEAVHYCIGRKSKALTVYFGELNHTVKAARENGWNASRC